MMTHKLSNHANNPYLSIVRNVVESGPVRNERDQTRNNTLEFKFTPSVDKLTDFGSLTGTYNNEGKLGLISDKTIVYVQPSAFIRDRLIPSYKL